MTFFTEEQLATGGEFTAGTEMKPIPNGTSVKAMIDDIKNDDFEGARYINARWTVLAPEQYKGRKVFHKIRVYDEDKAKADKAKRMLVAIASNTGGGLLQVKGEPSDADLQTNLLNKPMVIKLGVWELPEQDKSGNWVMAVSGTQTPASEAPAAEAKSDEIPW